MKKALDNNINNTNDKNGSLELAEQQLAQLSRLYWFLEFYSSLSLEQLKKKDLKHAYDKIEKRPIY